MNEKQYKLGLVVGKFYPFHKGHEYLIDTALSQCERVVVMVCACGPGVGTIDVDTRVRWIRSVYQQKSPTHSWPIVMEVDGRDLDDSDSVAWAEYTLKMLRGVKPDAVFTSESYGDPYAAALGCVHICVDKERVKIPCSGTMLRADPWTHREYLSPIVLRSFTKRVVLIGAESTGKTTLARLLARHYQTVWVPEAGRLYGEGMEFLPGGMDAHWQEHDLEVIGTMQANLGSALSEHANRVLIYDTDSLATAFWYDALIKDRRDRRHIIWSMLQEAATRPDLYIYCGTDGVPFHQDGSRDEQRRGRMDTAFRTYLTQSGLDDVVFVAPAVNRLESCIQAIDALPYGNTLTPVKV